MTTKLLMGVNKSNTAKAIVVLLLLCISLSAVNTSAVRLTEYDLPPNSPYVLIGAVFDIDGITPVDNATVNGTVIAANGTALETIEETTDQDGRYAITFGYWQAPPAGYGAIIKVVHDNGNFEETISFDNPNNLVQNHNITLKENIDDPEPEYLLPLELVVAIGGGLIILGTVLILHFKKKGGKHSEDAYQQERKRSNE